MLKNPTIAYLTWNTNNNGGNRVVFEHINRLYVRGYDIKLIIVFGKQPDWFDLKVDIQHIISSLKDARLDILVATFWPTVWIANFIKAKRKFYLVQGWEENLYKNKLIRKIAKLTHRFPFKKIAVSRYVEEKIKENSKNDLPIFRLNGSGIDPAVFKPKKRKSFAQGKEIKILSVVSCYLWCKGVDLLSQAVEKLKKLHPEYRFTLVSCEKRSFTPVFDRFISNAKPQELARLYQESHLLLLTSRYEGFSLPCLEAMACGCPVITTDSGGVKEFAIHNQNTVLLKNINQLWKEDVIERLINNKSLLKKLIINGYKTAEKYQWDTIIDSLEKIYAY